MYGLKPAAERAILAALPPDAGDEGLPLIVADIGAPEGKRILDSPQEYGENPVVFLCQETRLPDPGSLGAFPCAVALGRRCTPKALRLAVSTALRLYGTRRELAEYAGRLSDLERRARLLIDGYPDPVLISTMDGRILVANGEACSLFGMPEKRLEERFLWELAPNRQGEGWPDADELKLRIASIRRGEPVRFTWDRTADDGTVREVTLRQSVTPGGKFIQAVIRDDSLKYRIERKLLDCEGRLEALLRSFPFEFWTCDADGAITYQNAVSRERFGNHIGARFRDIGSEEILHLGRQENTAMALLGETIIVNHEYIAHGSYRSVHEVICPVNIEGMITGTMGFSIDTTDRSIAKKKLEHQERFQEDLIDSSPFGIMIYNARTRVISRINETLTRITGYTIEDIPDGPSWWRKAFPDPEYRERKMREHRDRYMPAIAEGLHLEPHEGRIQRKDGSYIWIEAYYARVGDLNVTFYTDITARKEAEQASAEMSGRLSQLLDFLPDPAFAIDHEGVVTFWNKAMEQLCECPAAEIVGKGNREYAVRFYGKDRPMLVDYVLDPSKLDNHPYDYIQEDGTTIIAEVKSVLGCGKEYYLWGKASPLFDGTGRRVGAIEIIRNVSMRKIQEQQLKQSEEKFRTIFETLPVGFFRTDLAGHLLEANPEMGRIFGFEDRTSVFSVINKTVLPMYQDPTQREGLIEELQSSDGTLQRRVAMKKIDGSAFPANLTIRLIRDESGKPLYLQGLIEDVSERERMYEMMVESEKFLTVAGLAAGMAHEINNPLGIIIQTAENLERRLLGDLPANDSAAAASGLTMEGIRTYARHRGIDTYISDISVAVNRAARIVTNMLQFSRKNEKQTGPCDVEAVIDKAIDLAGTDYSLKRRYDFKRIRIIRVRANPPPVRCLESQLEQVLFNLLRNAAEAMAGMESLDRKPAIRIVTFLEERWVGIEIEDNGPGMDEETMRRIFEPFFTTKPRGEGTGLGLSVSHYIIANIMSGTIGVQSRRGEWCRFTIRLPREPVGQKTEKRGT